MRFLGYFLAIVIGIMLFPLFLVLALISGLVEVYRAYINGVKEGLDTKRDS